MAAAALFALVDRVVKAWSEHVLRWRREGSRAWAPTATPMITSLVTAMGPDRIVIVGFLEDGPKLIALAMNGWDEGHPAWWLNLEANPDAVHPPGGQQPRPVHARATTGEERERLWQRWLEINPELDAYASRRSIATPVVVFEPRDA